MRVVPVEEPSINGCDVAGKVCCLHGLLALLSSPCSYVSVTVNTCQRFGLSYHSLMTQSLFLHVARKA